MSFLDELRQRVHAGGPVPPPVALWLEKVDEEIAVVTRLLAIWLTEKQQYTTEETLAKFSVPLGHGRSFQELVEELQRCGIIRKTSEETSPGSCGAADAQRNPTWELGRMFYWMRRYMRDTGLLERHCVPDWYP